MPKELVTSDYLLFWDKKKKAVVIATGPFRGRVYQLDRAQFFSRRWPYAGILDGHRLKRINYATDRDIKRAYTRGLKKIYRSALQEVPKEFRGLLQ